MNLAEIEGQKEYLRIALATYGLPLEKYLENPTAEAILPRDAFSRSVGGLIRALNNHACSDILRAVLGREDFWEALPAFYDYKTIQDLTEAGWPVLKERSAREIKALKEHLKIVMDSATRRIG